MREDPRARLEELIRNYSRLLRRVVARVGGRETTLVSEDIEQTVVYRIWRLLEREQTIEYPTSYVYRAAVRETMRTLHREQAKRRVASQMEELDGEIEPSRGRRLEDSREPPVRGVEREPGRELAGKVPFRRRGTTPGRRSRRPSSPAARVGWSGPGWTVTIDGVPVPAAVSPVPVRGTMRFELPAGEHRVVLALTPTPVRRAGMLVTALTSLLLVAGASVGRLKL